MRSKFKGAEHEAERLVDWGIANQVRITPGTGHTGSALLSEEAVERLAFRPHVREHFQAFRPSWLAPEGKLALRAGDELYTLGPVVNVTVARKAAGTDPGDATETTGA